MSASAFLAALSVIHAGALLCALIARQWPAAAVLFVLAGLLALGAHAAAELARKRRNGHPLVSDWRGS